jgi:E3 ubiquitin-protein ligase UBR7
MCECGTNKLPGSRCEVRKTVGGSEESGEATAGGTSADEATGEQGYKKEEMEGYKYNQNFWGRFCCCEIVYEPEKEVGMMHQCLLGDQCREDWFHDTCLVGQAPPIYHKTYNFKQHEATEAKESKTGDAEGTDKPAEQAEKAQTATDSTESRAFHTAENSGSKSAAPEACKAPVATVEETGLAEGSEGPKGSESTAQKTDSTESAVSTFAATEEDEDDDDEDKRALSLGYPKEFAHMICFRCVDANHWLRRWASLEGFFALDRNPTKTLVPDAGACKEVEQASQQGKRKAEDDLEENGSQSPMKRARAEGMDTSVHDAEADVEPTTTSPTSPTPATITTTASTEAGPTPRPGCRLPPSSSSPSALPASFSLLLPSTFRSRICRCMFCYPNLIPHPVLMEEEESYTPPVSRSPSPTGSMYDEGEKALNTMDRVKAIEGVLAYNNLKETVKAFLTPFAKEGRVVASEDVKDLFEGLKNGKGKK